MGYSANFLYNEVYGAEHINKISERLVSSGVNTIMVDNEFYDTTDLNKITEQLTTDGVTHNIHSCRVIKYDDIYFKILGGSAFFFNGLAIDVDRSGVMLERLSGHNYIYFKYDEHNKSGYPVISNSPPSTYDIPLAEYEDGILADKRARAVSKIDGFGSNASETITFSLPGIEVKSPTDGKTTLTYRVGSIAVTNPERYTRVIATEPYNTMIAVGKIATSYEANDADYSYAYYTKTDGFVHFESGGQKTFMIYGRFGQGKIYASFIPSAVGFDLYLTVERYTLITSFDIRDWTLTFC